MKIIPVQDGVPIKCWADEIDAETLKQAKNLAVLEFAFKHIAIMPDCHKGFGMPIGGVLAAKDAIVPNAVGVDIGCGMRAVRTSIKEIDRQTIINIIEKIRDYIPVGFKHHPVPKEWSGFDRAPDIAVIQRELNSSKRQLGTLGGGNHFIEIQQDKNTGSLWLMVHSGSRNFGLKIASEFHKLAKKECEKRKILLPDKDLAFFYFDSKEGREYYTAMNFALEFARENRKRMMDVIKEIFASFTNAKFEEEIDIHHNYASKEKHFGKEVIVHRKGATAAFKNLKGIIPGSQGSSSFIVEGKGNQESFMSCSHGAGRRLSRREANRILNEQECEAVMKDIIHEKWHNRFDEAPQAYKDINIVMAQQKDLVKIIYELKPLGVIKGDADLNI